MDDIIILIFCQTGFGDHYSSLITGFNALNDLKLLNFNPKIVIAKGHKYFPQYVDLSVIYDLNSFKHDNLIQVNYEDVNNITKDYELLLFTSIQIWVRKKTDVLLEYVRNHKHISRSNRDMFSKKPNLEFNIINQDIVDNSNELTSNKKNLVGVHFRGGDNMLFTDIEYSLSHDFWGGEMKRVIDVINDHPDSEIMICSINKSICEYFSNMFSNVFFNTFEKNNLPMHNIIGNNDRPENVDMYINHSKDILTEMVSFSNCQKIFSFNTFSSNFILYGIINNKIFTEWEDKSKILIF